MAYDIASVIEEMENSPKPFPFTANEKYLYESLRAIKGARLIIGLAKGYFHEVGHVRGEKWMTHWLEQWGFEKSKKAKRRPEAIIRMDNGGSLDETIKKKIKSLKKKNGNNGLTRFDEFISNVKKIEKKKSKNKE